METTMYSGIYNLTPVYDNDTSTTPITYWPVWSAILLTVVTLIGTVGNVFIIGAVAISTRLRTKGNAFVVNLAVADLLVCAYVMPMGIATSQGQIIKFGGVLCDINAFVTMTTCGVSTQTLMLIAIERYFHVCRLNWHHRIFTPVTTGIYIFIIWVYTMAWTCQGWTGWTIYIDGGSAHICLTSASASISYIVCLAIFGMIIPMVVIGISYIKIFSMVTESKKSLSAHQTPQKPAKNPMTSKQNTKVKQSKESKKILREYRLILTLFTIVLIFIACWLPVSLVLLITTFAKVPKALFIFVIWLAMCNSVMNSFVYGILNKNFRNGYKRFFRYIFCCCGHVCSDDHCKCTQVSMSSDDNQSEKSLGKQSTGAQTYMSQLSSKSNVNDNPVIPADNSLPEVDTVNNTVSIYVSDSNNNFGHEGYCYGSAVTINSEDGLVIL